jgi:hypothetical protein
MSRRLLVLRRRRTAVRVGAAVLAVALLVPLSGCSGGDDDDKDAPSADTTSSSSSKPADPQVRTRSKVGAVVGRLPAAGKQRVRRDVAGLIDVWWQRAYVGDYPRTSLGNAFVGFTGPAQAQARRDKNLLSNVAIGNRLTDVEAVSRRVVVDVLAVKRQPVAATARVTLLMQLTGKQVNRRDRISGRVLLTFKKGRWRVFGYDLRREMIT